MGSFAQWKNIFVYYMLSYAPNTNSVQMLSCGHIRELSAKHFCGQKG